MENIKNLDWSWKKLLSPPEQLNSFKKIFTETDIFYCHLNDLDPNFDYSPRKKENEKYKCFDKNNNFIFDPRTNQIIDKFNIDHTTHGEYLSRTSIFRKFPKRSSLTKDEHKVCLRVLQKLKKNEILSELETKIFDDTTRKRSEEYKLYMDFVIEKMSTKSITSNEKQLNDIYKSYLSKESELILAKTNLNFTLQTALPLPWSFETLNELNLDKCRIIKQQGYLPQYSFIDFTKLRINWENKLNNLWEYKKKSNINLNNIYGYDIIIPEETLILLLGAFEEYNCGWELILEVQDTQDNKVLKFNNPLPLRFINHTTNTFVFEQKVKEFLNKSSQFNWMEFSNNDLIYVNNEVEEINAINLDMDYKIKEIDRNIVKHEPRKIKTNNILITCELNNVKNGNILNLLIDNSSLDFCYDKEASTFLNLSLKLQYKIQFGSEVMAKSELLKEWIRQTIIPNSVTKRCHIDVNSFSTVLNETLTLIDIENDLKNIYNIKPVKLIASLEEFFKLLLSFPCNKYLLKYDPNHKTKLMIYKEENEKVMTTTTLSIYDLYKNVLENCNSLQNKNVLPISSTVITQLHQRYQIIPSCFPYWCDSETGISNDRNSIIENERLRKKALAKRNVKKQRKRKLSKQ